MAYWVNIYHLGGISIDDEPYDTDFCETCGDSDSTFGFDTLEEACLYVLEEYGEYTLKECGYEISKLEVRKIDESGFEHYDGGAGVVYWSSLPEPPTEGNCIEIPAKLLREYIEDNYIHMRTDDIHVGYNRALGDLRNWLRVLEQEREKND
ncbi:TPA: hypothetical protein ACGO1T_000876 [Streptococcus suis]